MSLNSLKWNYLLLKFCSLHREVHYIEKFSLSRIDCTIILEFAAFHACDDAVHAAAALAGLEVAGG